MCFRGHRRFGDECAPVVVNEEAVWVFFLFLGIYMLMFLNNLSYVSGSESDAK